MGVPNSIPAEYADSYRQVAAQVIATELPESEFRHQEGELLVTPAFAQTFPTLRVVQIKGIRRKWNRDDGTPRMAALTQSVLCVLESNSQRGWILRPYFNQNTGDTISILCRLYHVQLKTEIDLQPIREMLSDLFPGLKSRYAGTVIHRNTMW